MLQIGELISRSVSFSYFVDGETYERLRKLNESDGILILRNAQFGTIYGTIDGNLEDEPKTFGTVNHNMDENQNTSGVNAEVVSIRRGYQVSFTFTEADFAQEVPL